MPIDGFLGKIRSFFGFSQNDQPTNDFRNPIWSTEDDEEVDELYHQDQFQSQVHVYNDPFQFHKEMTKQLHEMISSFSGLFGDVKSLFPEDNIMSLDPDVPENAIETNIRDYYLKPGYQDFYEDLHKKDVDLDGKVSSQDISGLLKKRDSSSNTEFMHHFKGDIVSPRKSFFQTIITTSIKKPDGTIETKRIVKNENGVVEETTTTTSPQFQDQFQSQVHVYNDPFQFHKEMTKQLHEMISSFSGLFGDVKSLFPEDNIMSLDPDVPENAIETNIRDYYLKPGYQDFYEDLHKKDVDLDGKVSSQDISGLLKKRDSSSNTEFMHHFKGDIVSPRKSFFQTIITTSIKKPDGTIETKRIVKNENGVVEETTTTTSPQL